MKPALPAWQRWPALCAVGLLLLIFVPLNFVLSLLNAGTLGIVEWAAERWANLTEIQGREP